MEQYSDEKRQRMLYSINFDLANHEDVVLDANALNVALDSPIFRIYDYQRFLELLRDGRNVLVRPSCWEDPFENMLYNVQYYKQINGHRCSIDVSKVRDQWYGQCWTDRQEECDGLWRVYSNNRQKRCVRVKSTVRKMFRPLYDFTQKGAVLRFFVGKVDYDEEIEIIKLLKTFAATFATDTTNLCQAKTLLTKRKEFSYESEIRLLYNEIDSNNKSLFYSYAINPNSVFEEVMLDPWCEEKDFALCEEEIRNKGYNGNILKSALYEPMEIEVNF